MYFYIVKYMLVEAWPEPIGMSCGDHMHATKLAELFYDVPNIF